MRKPYLLNRKPEKSNKKWLKNTESGKIHGNTAHTNILSDSDESKIENTSD